MNPSDRIRARSVQYQIKSIQEHLEAMQRDVHSLEYLPWKEEVDILWKSTFQQISKMEPSAQHHLLEAIRDLWTSYLTHYAND